MDRISGRFLCSWRHFREHMLGAQHADSGTVVRLVVLGCLHGRMGDCAANEIAGLRWRCPPELLVLRLNHKVKNNSRDRPESERRESAGTINGELSWTRAPRLGNCGKKISIQSPLVRLYTLASYI